MANTDSISNMFTFVLQPGSFFSLSVLIYCATIMNELLSCSEEKKKKENKKRKKIPLFRNKTLTVAKCRVINCQVR